MNRTRTNAKHPGGGCFLNHLHYVSRVIPLLLLLLPATSPAFDLFDKSTAGHPQHVVLEVVEPYIDMHTGPGRGYPVFNVVEQGDSIEILMHRASWYQVRSADGKTGWASAASLAHTLEPTGEPVDLPEISRADYLKSRWRVGFTTGAIENASSFSLTAGYRPLNWAEVEIEGGKIFDQSVTSDYAGINFLMEPRLDWIISPYVSLGGGVFSFNSRHKVLVSDTGSQNFGSIGAGAGYYIGRNIVIRAGLRSYSVSSSEGRVWLNAWTIGVSTFF